MRNTRPHFGENSAYPQLGMSPSATEFEILQQQHYCCRFSKCVADSHSKWRKMADPPSE